MGHCLKGFHKFGQEILCSLQVFKDSLTWIITVISTQKACKTSYLYNMQVSALYFYLFFKSSWQVVVFHAICNSLFSYHFKTLTSTSTAEGKSTFQDMGFKARMSVKASANRRKEGEGTKEKKKTKLIPPAQCEHDSYR